MIRHQILFCLPLALSFAAVRAQQPAATDPFATLAALPAKPAVERGVRVVVKDANGDPQPQAFVVVLASADDRYSGAWTTAATAFPGDVVMQSAHACTLAGGERFELDERGATALPRVSGFVLAWHDGAFAAKSFQVNDDRPPARVDLTLAPAWTGVVEVVDVTGRPTAGVPIGMANGNTVSVRHTTDASGHATLRTFAARVTDQTTARLLIAANTRIEVPTPANGGTIRLQLPECGSVHATYTGALLPGSELRWSLRHDGREVRPTATGAREATFAFVQVGYEGELRVAADGATIDKPARGVTAGTTLELEAVRQDQGRYLVVRPMTPDGKPVPKGYVDTRWTHEQGSSSSGASANREGWLELQVPEDAKSAKLSLAVHSGSWSTPLLGTFEIELTAADQGRIDKGEVKLTRPEVMLVGQVVDPSGKPLPGIRLHASSTEDTQSAFTDAAGRFEFALPGGKPAELTVRLMTAGWFFVDPIATSCSVPTSEPARLVLQPAGRVRFAAPGLPADVVHSFAARVEPADGSGGHIEVALQFDREFLSLPAGQWHFVVARNDQEVHRLETVRVDAGVEVHDPRFMAFDWKAFATLMVVHVEDADGAPTDACSVWLRRGGAGHGRTPSNGLVRWLVSDDGSTLHVEPREKQLKQIDLGRAGAEVWVRLGAGPRLELRVEPAPKLPANATLVARVGARAEPVVIDATGKGVVWLDATGDHAVQLAVRVGDTLHDLAEAKRNVDVAAGGSVLTFPVAATLQSAIDKFAPK